ncbi:hypothetical protein [Prosthecodimorpha hirschii]|uniref:hypothetical protein n=1 Tax=Prosthecodimorpha hirschii TaxID=665126 RepID=UPI00112DFBF1|nr:hypothetical protein [Prosthecomicrobium hirschii]
MRPRLSISIGAELLTRIGADHHSRFDVMVGRGESHGLIRLRKSQKGIVRPNAAPKGDSLVFNLGWVDVCPARREDAQGCEAEAVDVCTIEIVLPAWSDETRPGRVAPPASNPARGPVPALPAPQTRALPAPITVPEEVESALDKVPTSVPYRSIGGLRFSPAEAAIVEVLHRREIATRDALMAATADDIDNDERNGNIIGVHLTKMRGRLFAIGVVLETVTGVGWKISRQHKRTLDELLKEGAGG